MTLRNIFLATMLACGLLGCAPPDDLSGGQSADRLSIVVLIDKTQSAAVTRTVQPELHEFEPLISLLSQFGGELAVGAIGDSEYETRHGLPQLFVRLRIDPPPEPPRLEGASNPIAALEQQGQQEEAHAVYERARAEHERRSSAAAQEFRSGLIQLLETRADGPYSDVVGALRRADLFLSEPGAEGSRKWLIGVTDGLHTETEEPAPAIESNPIVVLVNGGGKTGMFENLGPLRFESFNAATHHLTQEVEHAD